MQRNVNLLIVLLVLTTGCGWMSKKDKEQPLSRAQEMEHAKEQEKRGDYRKAIVTWQKLQKSDPENGYFLYHIGWNYSRLKEYAKAEKFLKQSLEQDKENVDAMLALGYVYLHTEHFEQAKNLFAAVLKQVPDYESAEKGLADVKRREEVAAIEKAREEKKEAVRTQLERADHFEREGEMSQAMVEWKKLAVEEPDNAYYLYQIGRLYHKMDDQEKAREFLTRSIRLDPKNADAKVILANVYRDLKNNEEARVLFQDVLKEHPNYEDAKIGLESIQKGERYAHEQRLKERAKQRKKDLMFQAEQYEKQDRFQEAIAVWMTLLDDSPDHAYYLYKIGSLYAKLQEDAKAEKFLKKSVSIDPDDVDAQLALGYAYLKLDHLEAAKEAFEEVLKRVPDYQSAKEGLKLVEKRLATSPKKKSW